MEDSIAKIMDCIVSYPHKPLIFIGFMGSGKTTIGKEIARRLGYDFVDIDEYIQERYQKSITSIFEEHGENAFREIETNILYGLTLKPNLVISTGGGLPCFNKNMDFLNEKGTTIYLKTSIEVLVSRLKNNMESRPLLKNMKDDALHNFIDQKLREREKFYESAHIIIKNE